MNEVFATEQIGFPILTVLVFFPLVVATTLVFIQSRSLVRRVALGGALVELALALVVVFRFVSGSPDIQFAERVQTAAGTIGTSYHVGVDGISVLFVPLTALLTVFIVLASWRSVTFLPRAYYMAILAMCATTMGIFVSLDFILFFIFWELLLIPSYFLLKLWGIGPDRQYAGLRYVMTMLLGSAAMLLGIVLLGLNHREATGEFSFDLLALLEVPVPEGTQTLVFFLLLFGFAVKAPLFPFHTWVARVMMEGPMGATVFLAGLKLGVYGFIRFVIPLAPEAAKEWFWLVAILAIVGILYGGVIALVQPNFRRLLAFATLGHAGIAVLGVFSLNAQGLQGGIFMVVNLAVSTSGLILLTAFLHARTGSSEVSAHGGVMKQAPLLGATFFIVGLASIGVPGTIGFPGEFLSLMGALQISPVLAVFGVLGVILSAAYFFRYFQSAFLGPVKRNTRKLPDLRPREAVVAASVVALVIFFGLFPNLLLDTSSGSVEMLVERLEGAGISADTSP